MHFDQISYSGTKFELIKFGPEIIEYYKVCLKRYSQYIGTVETPEIASPWDCLPSLWVGVGDGCYEVCILGSGDFIKE